MKSNLALIVLFSMAAFLGLYSFGVLQSDSRITDKLFSEKFLEQLEFVRFKTSVSEVSLSKSLKELNFGLEKKIYPGQWLVSEPTLAAPDIESLNKLFSSMTRLKALNQIDSGALTEFGLESPVAVLEARSDNKTKRLKIGLINPISKRRYAQFDGDKKVVLLDDGEVSALLKLELRDLFPLKINSASISKFSIDSKNDKTFSRTQEFFQLDGEKNLDPNLVERYLQEILALPAKQLVNLTSNSEIVYSKLSFDWRDSQGSSHSTEVLVYQLEGENFFLNLPSSSVAYQYGPELGRLLNRRVETFLNRKLLRNIELKDFYASCPGLRLTDGCKDFENRAIGYQDIFRRVEVLDLERLPGRLMTATRAECRLKLESSRVLFEIGTTVSSEDTVSLDSPRLFVADIGSDHYRGVISGLVAQDFCLTVDRLCSEARAACEG